MVQKSSFQKNFELDSNVRLAGNGFNSEQILAILS